MGVVALGLASMQRQRKKSRRTKMIEKYAPGGAAVQAELKNQLGADGLPPLPISVSEEKWQEISGRCGNDQQRSAVRYLLAGWGYRQAAEHAGYRTQGTVSDLVRRLDIHDLISAPAKRLATLRHAETLLAEEIVRRAEDGDKLKEESLRDVSTSLGIVADKARMLEEKEKPTGALSMLAQLAEAVKAGKVELSLTVSSSDQPEPTTLEAEIIPEGVALEPQGG